MMLQGMNAKRKVFISNIRML